MLIAKATAKIEIWNVRTLYQTGKTAQVIKNLKIVTLLYLELLKSMYRKWEDNEERYNNSLFWT